MAREKIVGDAEFVIRSWLRGKVARTSSDNLSTYGDTLKSYAMTIGQTINGEKMLLKPCESVSNTTDKHIHMAARIMGYNRAIPAVYDGNGHTNRNVGGIGGNWRFPFKNEIYVVCDTRKGWKTVKGAEKHLYGENSFIMQYGEDFHPATLHLASNGEIARNMPAMSYDTDLVCEYATFGGYKSSYARVASDMGQFLKIIADMRGAIASAEYTGHPADLDGYRMQFAETEKRLDV